VVSGRRRIFLHRQNAPLILEQYVNTEGRRRWCQAAQMRGQHQM